MGGFIVQKYLENGKAPAAVLVSSAPPRSWFLTSLRLSRRHPWLAVNANVTRRSLSMNGAPARGAHPAGEDRMWLRGGGWWCCARNNGGSVLLLRRPQSQRPSAVSLARLSPPDFRGVSRIAHVQHDLSDRLCRVKQLVGFTRVCDRDLGGHHRLY